MENNEDIKMVEERIDYFKNNPEGCNWKLSFEDDEDIQAIENLLSRLKTAERMIELMADFMNKRSWKEHQVKDEACCCCKTEFGSDECKQCIIEYFRNKAKESE